MYKNGKYRETDKMSDLICENYPMVLVMSRFGIALGFGEKNIGEVCRQNGVDPCTFLTVVNFLTEEISAPMTNIDKCLSIEALITYLHNAHAYFLDFRLPHIRRKLTDAIADCPKDVAFVITKFFDEYAKMPRSREGLSAAGEWHQLKPLFPSVKGKKILDLGCGYGWHCKFAAEQGAAHVLGIDLSSRMIEEAKKRNAGEQIEYRVCRIDEYEYPENTWDCVISNLALHYIEDIELIFQKIHRTLKPDGIFLFNIEHPVFTAGVGQDWIYTDVGTPKYWPIDNYFFSGERKTHFLGCDVVKQHHTLTQIMMGLLNNSFELKVVEEAEPPQEMMDIPGFQDELRRPMMLLVKSIARKPIIKEKL